MTALPARFWHWLRTRIESARWSGTRRPRRLRMQAFSSAAAEVEVLESRQLLTVTYHGGALLTHVEAQAVYLGSDWNSNSTLKSQTGTLDNFVSTVVSGPYMDMLTNAGYNVGRGTASAGAIDNITLNKTTTGISDAQIQSDIQAMIKSGQLQAPDANRLYIVYVEPGVIVRMGSDASNTTFLGYHGAFAGHTASGQAADIHYAVIPYPGSPNFSASSQGFSSNLNEMTSVSSHELAEAVTDPNVNYKTLGWYDDTYQGGGEIGDYAEGHNATITATNGTVFEVQDVVNKNDQIISPSTTTTTPPPSSTLSAPQNVTVSALTTTTAQLSWSSVSGAQGYRIYQMNGSQKTLLGTVSSSATSVQITGLTPGATQSFMVEAYNSTATADSQVVSVTMPASNQLAAPQVTATALSSTSALLSWNSVSGAQGYSVYWWNGSRAVLLGSVGPSTTAVQITGLNPGTTSYFLVEAYNRTQVADSQWVAVTTSFARTADPATIWMAMGSSVNSHTSSRHDAAGWIS